MFTYIVWYQKRSSRLSPCTWTCSSILRLCHCVAGWRGRCFPAKLLPFDLLQRHFYNEKNDLCLKQFFCMFLSWIRVGRWSKRFANFGKLVDFKLFAITIFHKVFLKLYSQHDMSRSGLGILWSQLISEESSSCLTHETAVCVSGCMVLRVPFLAGCQDVSMEACFTPSSKSGLS